MTEIQQLSVLNPKICDISQWVWRFPSLKNLVIRRGTVRNNSTLSPVLCACVRAYVCIYMYTYAVVIITDYAGLGLNCMFLHPPCLIGSCSCTGSHFTSILFNLPPYYVLQPVYNVSETFNFLLMSVCPWWSSIWIHSKCKGDFRLLLDFHWLFSSEALLPYYI